MEYMKKYCSASCSRCPETGGSEKAGIQIPEASDFYCKLKT